jgi:lysophospholipase L1-like esterase
MIKYLALGDSYTKGESLPLAENFPNQLVKILQETNIEIYVDKIIAITGWTTDELAQAIYQQQPSCDYDWVTLLIGVNNQYRGRSIEEYAWQFYGLLCQAILFAKGNAQHVIVLSIPDWGLTPFNTTKDKIETSESIDKFNAVNKMITEKMGCRYLDITSSTREHANDKQYLADDLLHYSSAEYHIWAKEIARMMSADSKK